MNIESTDKASFPMPSEGVIESISNKQRVVVFGSDSNSACVLSVLILKELNVAVDYILLKKHFLISDQVRLSDSPIVIIEGAFETIGPEKVSHCLLYNHHIGLVCADDGSYEKNALILEQFADYTPKGGILMYFKNSKMLKQVCDKNRVDVKAVPYYSYEDVFLRDGMKYLYLPNDNKVLCSGIITPQNVGAVQCLVKNFAITAEEYFEALIGVVEQMH